MLLKLRYDEPVSNDAFKFNWRRYSAASGALLNTFVPQPPPRSDNPILPVTNGMNLNQFKAAVTSPWQGGAG